MTFTRSQGRQLPGSELSSRPPASRTATPATLIPSTSRPSSCTSSTSSAAARLAGCRCRGRRLRRLVRSPDGPLGRRRLVAVLWGDGSTALASTTAQHEGTLRLRPLKCLPTSAYENTTSSTTPPPTDSSISSLSRTTGTWRTAYRGLLRQPGAGMLKLFDFRNPQHRPLFLDAETAFRPAIRMLLVFPASPSRGAGILL